ncbi:ArsR/SmtB family transcription factor [Oceanirhabdus sp. W0125-5]|uniref:ArsR/SmtB family transcription factor n=1 Tax=Oceanirhabdus sp. W0125-5 TaxID=2999116 RepID=UPI0022F33688|nr:metalloregulator ArsR/SmtB family transcription factor [Oceanirhabdus sp. W0125-5]WBW96334.1 metalloregulator ArsR/SmtB family transcription factor [Oceanirhabdus sp. W0125-5]
MDFVDIFKMLSDETRIRILNLLVDNKLCVCEIETILDITQSNASRHLNRLKTAKIIDSYKESQWIYYTIHEKFIAENKKLYDYLIEQVQADDQCKNDLSKLKRYEKSSYTRSDIREKKDEVATALKIKCNCHN